MRPRYFDRLVGVGFKMPGDEVADLLERVLVIGLSVDEATGLVGSESAARPTELDGPVELRPPDAHVVLGPFPRALLELPAEIGEVLRAVPGRDVRF